MNRKIFYALFTTVLYSFVAAADSTDDMMILAAQTRDKMMNVRISPDFRENGRNLKSALPTGWTWLSDDEWSTLEASQIFLPYMNGWILDSAGAPRLSFFYYVGDARHDYSPSWSVSVLGAERSDRLAKEFQSLTSDKKEQERQKLDILLKDQEAATQMARGAGCYVAEVDEKGSLICMGFEGHDIFVVHNVHECHSIDPVCSSWLGFRYLTGLHCTRTIMERVTRFMLFNGYFQPRCR